MPLLACVVHVTVTHTQCNLSFSDYLQFLKKRKRKRLRDECIFASGCSLWKCPIQLNVHSTRLNANWHGIVWVSQSVRSFRLVARQVSACVRRDILTGPVHQAHPSCVTYCIIMRLEERLSCVINVFIKLLAAKITELRLPKGLKSRTDLW